ncbi:MAG: 3,4-dihydroxy-2-butanone-4-phosphate synthase [Zetaproteobacteria bacterium]|nr:3,4-dihydroxy-2-butanone-4-phosphate synthase [Zetaproteobacteria bacterium]
MSGDHDSIVRRVEMAIDAFKKGRMVIMTDDESRENEGDLVIAATDATPEAVNFMATHGRGLICLSLSGAIVDKLELGMMEDRGKHGAPLQTAFTVSIEARKGVTTGISAADRSHTIQLAMEEGSCPGDFVVPGHVFPLRAKSGGVLERAGHTEGSVDLARLSGKKPGAVICEIMSADGTMARRPELEEFGKRYEIPLVSIEDLIHYRLRCEQLVKLKSAREVSTSQGQLFEYCFENLIDGMPHIVWTNFDAEAGGEYTADVRVHKQCPLDDLLAVRQGAVTPVSPLRYGFDLLHSQEPAVLVYLFQQDFQQSLRAELAREPFVEDPKVYGTGAQILRALGVGKMRLHVRKKPSLIGLHGFGLEVVDHILMESCL